MRCSTFTYYLGRRGFTYHLGKQDFTYHLGRRGPLYFYISSWKARFYILRRGAEKHADSSLCRLPPSPPKKCGRSAASAKSSSFQHPSSVQGHFCFRGYTLYFPLQVTGTNPSGYSLSTSKVSKFSVGIFLLYSYYSYYILCGDIPIQTIRQTHML